jgi:sialate O-acetylesterase
MDTQEGMMVRAALQAAVIFSDNMVLQRDRDVAVWGRGQEGADITLAFGESRGYGKVRRGVWNAVLPPHRAGERGRLEISSVNGGGYTETIHFENVIFGDVWFAGGQSNMEMELQNCFNGKAELAAADNSEIRFYQPVKRAFVDEDFVWEEVQCRWKECRPDTAAALSAAAYFFARKLNADLSIPIGIINCSWGGTSISAWMSEGQLKKSAAGQRFIDDYKALINGRSDAEYDAAMQDYFDQWIAWDKRVQARRAQDPEVSWEILNVECGECPWPQPAGNKSPYRPTNLYTAMVCRTAPYTLRGFLWYQGEEDDPRAADYGEMMYYLIDQWRSDWAAGGVCPHDPLPFLFVQLPMWASKTETDAGTANENWPLLREQQYKVSRTVANTGMAVIIDRGEFDNIHPLDKQTVGYRLALQALQKVYGKAVIADGPIFLRAAQEKDALRVYFANAAGGLESRGELTGFELAGADGVYHHAEAVIDGETVLVRARLPVANLLKSPPEQVRYAWVKYGPAPLFAKNGLPAMPFRSSAVQ